MDVNDSDDRLMRKIFNWTNAIISFVNEGEKRIANACDSMGHAKKEKAEKLGVKMISEDDFADMIGE